MGLDQTQELLTVAIDGDDTAQGELLERVRPRVVLWVASRMSPALRAKVEPEDVAQEILLAVHKAWSSFRGTNERSFFAWLFRIAENRIRDQVDHFGAAKRQAVPLLRFSQTSPSTRVARAEMVIRIQGALTHLSESHRKVIQLVRLEERPVAEVAELMDRSPNAIRVLYCRALKAMRQTMVDQEAGAR